MLSLKMTKGAELAEGVLAEVRLPDPLTRFSIGRDPANHWPIPDRTLAISARHCEIVATPAGAALRDVSTNGTFVNGGKLRLAGEHLLQHGDRIELGPFTLLVQSTPLRSAALPRPTELLPAAALDPDITRVRPPARPAPVAVVMATPPPTVEMRIPAAADVVTAADPWLRELATNLGLAPSALDGRDPAQTVAQVAALARAAVAALRELLEQQAQGRREIGSRAPALLAVRDVNPLRMAATPEAALRLLLRPGADVQAPVQRATAELAAHDARLMAAFRSAATRLGDEMAPASLEAALPRTRGAELDASYKAALWDLYSQLWQGIGLAPGQPWAQGFLEAAMLHLAAAYDEQGKDRR